MIGGDEPKPTQEWRSACKSVVLPEVHTCTFCSKSVAKPSIILYVCVCVCVCGGGGGGGGGGGVQVCGCAFSFCAGGNTTART